MKDKIKFAAISDLHGNLIDLEKEVDVLLIAGDVVPLDIQRNDRKSEKWFKEVYQGWAIKQPAKRIVLVAGNHDFFLYNKSISNNLPKINTALGEKTTYLENSTTIITIDEVPNKVVHIYGSPLCKIFYNWAFMYPYDYQREVFDKVRGLTKEKLRADFPGYDIYSIVLTHDAPYGCSDILLEKTPYTTGENLGNEEIRNLLVDMKPDLNLHGHLHSTNHDAEYIGDTEVRNVSILSESYSVLYEPYYFEV